MKSHARSASFPRISIRGFIEAQAMPTPSSRARRHFREFLFAALLKRSALRHQLDAPQYFREFLFAALLKRLHLLPIMGIAEPFPRISIRGFIEAIQSRDRRVFQILFPRISIRGFIEACIASNASETTFGYFREFLFAALLKQASAFGQ